MESREGKKNRKYLIKKKRMKNLKNLNRNKSRWISNPKVRNKQSMKMLRMNKILKKIRQMNQTQIILKMIENLDKNNKKIKGKRNFHILM